MNDITEQLWQFYRTIYISHRQVDTGGIHVNNCVICQHLLRLYPHKPVDLFKDWVR